jgi:hypothetical protein
MTRHDDGRSLPYVPHSDTSQSAATSMRRPAAQQRAEVYGAVARSLDGITCDAVEERLALRHQSCSARVRELAMDGAIVDSGRRCRTRSGRNAVVWVVKRTPRQANLFTPQRGAFPVTFMEER